MYGEVAEIPQSESTPFAPRSPYACAKLHAHWTVKTYRAAYGMFACSGLLFNHESPRRGELFVTRKVNTYKLNATAIPNSGPRKVTLAVAAIAAGLQSCVTLGNLDARRDWVRLFFHLKCFMRVVLI